LFIAFPLICEAQFFPYNIFPAFYFNYSNKLSTKSIYQVRLKNDSILKINAELDISENIHCLVIKEKNQPVQKIYPNQTKYIIDIGGVNLGTIGKAQDSCWLFQLSSDSLCLYGFIPADEMKYAVYFTKYNQDKLYIINKENLLPYAGSDSEILSLIRREKYIKAIKLINKKLNTRYTILKN
jgi:hypothetical protein